MNKRLEDALEILRRLQSHQHDAYIVGGFVRDHVLGNDSDDIDITTSATPQEVEALFDKVKHTGTKFGGVTVLYEDHAFEVTTFRKEGQYVKHRYPSEVTFSTNIEDDLVRRDFTVNALIMDSEQQIHDLVGGLLDINQNVLRAIGVPAERFEEDALRILRAFRFISKLGFTLEEQTQQAIVAKKHLISTIKIERVMQELDKLLSGPHAKQALQAMVECGVHTELYGLAQGIVFVSELPDDVEPLEFFILSFILNDIDDVWRFSNRDLRLIHQVMNLHEVTKNDLFNVFILFSNKLEPCLLANRINVLLGYPDQQDLIHTIWNNMPVKDVCDLAFKGQDILALTTLHQRSVIGLVIDDLLEAVLTGRLANDYNTLKPFALARVKQLQENMGENNE